MADIFNEIDEELRKDRAAEWLKQYGVYVVVAVSVIIALVAGYTWYEQNRIATAEAEAEEIAQAAALFLEEEPSAAAAALQDVAAQTDAVGTALLARMTAAGGLARSGDHAGAAALYSEVATDGSVDTLYRDLAQVFAVLHGALSGGDAQALLAQLEAQTGDNAPWRYTARMIAASLSISSGDEDAAKSFLQAVADDEEAPNSARGQAAEILRAIEG